MSTLKDRKLHFETLQLHVGQESADPVTDARAVPIYATTSYVFHNSQHAADRFALKDAGNIYGRLTNPTEDIFEQRIAALEGGTAALAVASGAAAIAYTIQALAKAGDNIVAAKTIYGGTYNLLEHTLPAYGITTTFVDPDEEGAFENAIDENTKALYIETLGNPNANLIDIEALAKIAHAHNIPLVVDSTFATPYLVRPFEYGADIVVHSATKFIGGHGTAIGGVIIESGKFDWAASGKFPQFAEPNPSYHGAVFTQAAPGAAFVTYIRAILLRDTGATISPFHAFIFLQGLETLSLRMQKHCDSALKIAKWLENNPSISWVNYPGLKSSKYYELAQKYTPKGCSSIVGFGLKGGAKAGEKFINSLTIPIHTTNIGDTRSIITYPYLTTHRQLSDEQKIACGVTDDFMRFSVGLEDVDDIIEDLDRAIRLSQC